MCNGTRTNTPSSSVDFLLELAATDSVNELSSLSQNLNSFGQWYGRSVNQTQKQITIQERTPLMIAALYGNLQTVQHLINNKSDVNLKSKSDGATALHLAASGGSDASLEVVKLLLDNSADVEAVDIFGQRAGDVVAKRFARALESLLKGKKKEYLVDATMPDIKNGIYSTDEFRMYCFKVKPCSRAYSHDWTECPFVHPGENARRRDPRKYVYSCVPCPEFRKGACRNGDGCEYAHGVFECWLHPAQYRTRLCKDEVGCNRRVCFFAHKKEELRSVLPWMLGLEGYQQKLFDEMSSPSPSPRANTPWSPHVMSARATAFAQRSQSFRQAPAYSAGMSADWGSVDGKLDWGIHGEELSKFRKSASFAYRANNGSASPPKLSAAAMAVGFDDEPDLSWVQNLVKA